MYSSGSVPFGFDRVAGDKNNNSYSSSDMNMKMKTSTNMDMHMGMGMSTSSSMPVHMHLHSRGKLSKQQQQQQSPHQPQLHQGLFVAFPASPTRRVVSSLSTSPVSSPSNASHDLHNISNKISN